MISMRTGLYRPRRMQRSDRGGFVVKDPKPHPDGFEGGKVVDGFASFLRRKNNNGLMSKALVPGRLAHGRTPVRKLHLEGADGMGLAACKGLDVITGGVFRFPGHREQVGDAEAVDRNLTDQTQAVKPGAGMNAGELVPVFPGETDGE